MVRTSFSTRGLDAGAKNKRTFGRSTICACVLPTDESYIEFPPCDEYILKMQIGQGPNRATPNRPKSNVQPFRSKRLHKSLKFRAEQPNFRSKLFSEFLLRLKQPGDAYCHCVAFVICLIDLFADKTMLRSGNLFLGCFSTADQQLFDSGYFSVQTM